MRTMPSACMAANAISTPIGSVRIAPGRLRACSRNSTHTGGDDQTLFDKSAVSVWIARPDQSERS